MASNWVDAPIKYRRLVLAFMLRCSRPMEINGKPFYYIRRSTFTDVRLKEEANRKVLIEILLQFLRRIYTILALLLEVKK